MRLKLNLLLLVVLLVTTLGASSPPEPVEPKYWPQATPLQEQWTANSRLYQLGDNTFRVNSTLGVQNYLDGGTYHAIDLDATEPESGGSFTVQWTKAPMWLRMGDDSFRCLYPDRNDTTYWVCIGKPFDNMGAPVKNGTEWLWDFPNAQIKVKVFNTGAKLSFLLKNDSAPNSITFPLITGGVVREGRFLKHEGEVVAELSPPFAVDANGVERQVDVSFGLGEVTLTLDTTGLTYPIDVDPTLDLDVSASENDAGTDDGGSTWTDDNERMDCGGSNTDERAARFTGVSGLSGATIDQANFAVAYRSSELGSMANEMKVELSEAPAMPTSYADFTGRTWSTGTTWDAYSEDTGDLADYTTPIDIKAEVQELIDGGNNPSVILVGCFGDGSGNLRAYSIDRAGEPGAYLDIQYTEGAAGGGDDGQEQTWWPFWWCLICQQSLTYSLSQGIHR